GISPTAGLTTHHEVEAQTNRALVRTAARAAVVADSSKLGRRGFAKIGDLDLVSDLITDAAAPPDAVSARERAGIKVHLVDASGPVDDLTAAAALAAPRGAATLGRPPSRRRA